MTGNTTEQEFEQEAQAGAYSEETLSSLQSPEVLQALEPEGFMMTPGTLPQLAHILMLAQEREQPLALIEAEARQLPQPVWLNVRRMNKIRNYRVSDLTLTVETGITMGALQSKLMAKKHEFPLRYPAETLLIDVLAEDRPSLETGFLGYPRDYVLGVELVGTDGQTTHYGAEVVKNVTGYDLNKLYVGSYHTLGVMTAVTLKVAALYDSTRSWLFEFETVHQGFQTLQRLLSKGLPLTKCEIYHRQRLSPEQQAKAVAPWQMLLEAAGDNGLLKHVTPVVRELVVLPESESNLLPAREATLLEELSSWPENALVVEVALPLNSLEDFYFRVSSTFLGNQMPILQIRPAAGLLYMLWMPDKMPDLKVLSKDLKSLRERIEQLNKGGGALRVIQIPVENFQAYLPLSDQFNLPSEPVVCGLMEKFKASYDPNNILYSYRLPLRRPAFEKGFISNQPNQQTGMS